MRRLILLAACACASALRTPSAHVRGAKRPRATIDDAPPPPSTGRWLGGLALAGAGLGPVCDNLHSGFGVLRYAKYEVAVGAAPAWWGDGHLFQTAGWVPPLFAAAALIIGGIDVVVDGDGDAPASGRVAAAVAAFVGLYALSAFCAGTPLGLGLGAGACSVVLWPLAIALWATLDGTPGGAIAGAATAVGGPAIEIALLGGGGVFPEPLGHLYAYARPDVLGIASWILPVYFAGGPAVALVSRWIRARA